MIHTVFISLMYSKFHLRMPTNIKSYYYSNLNFSVAISTIFLSFIEDCEVNDGSPEKPYANKATQKYFGKRVQKLKQKQKGLSTSKTELREMS